MSERRCGTCRLYPPSEDGESGYCDFGSTGAMPFWIKAAIYRGDSEVDPDDGEHCDTWEAKDE